MIDIRDPKHPTFAGCSTTGAHDAHAIDRNLYIRGRYAYEANYKAGLRVLDIENPMDPKEVGYFDTAPNAENNTVYGGAWGNYPYFKSGAVGISSISEGFFLVRFRPPATAP